MRASDDNPEDDTLDLYLDCGPSKPKQVIAVGLKPTDVDGTVAIWSTHYDSSLAPANCELKSIVMDGFNRSGFTALGTETVDNGPNALVAAISSPRPSANILQYGLIPLRGSIRNAEIELAGGQLLWTLNGPGITRSGTGTILDLQPPQPPFNGWPNGSYTATLTTTGAGPSGTDTVTFNVRTDSDNDGMSSTTESQVCFGTNADNDPLNGDDDSDNDGIPNADDPQPCAAASSYNAIIDFNPDPFPTPSNGNTVTVSVRVPGRNVGLVLSNTVRITNFAGESIPSTDTRLQEHRLDRQRRGRHREVRPAEADRLAGGPLD